MMLNYPTSAHHTIAALSALLITLPCWSHGRDINDSADSENPLGGETLLTAPAIVQEKIREWVAVKKLQSEEAAAWQKEQQELADLNVLRRKEIASIDELIETAGNRFSDARNERDRLQAEEVSLQATSQFSQSRLVKLEQEMLQQIDFFPLPLMEKVTDEIDRLKSPPADHTQQNRWRDLLAILGAAYTFQNSITIHTELRERGDERIEVEVIYLGFAQAWFVDHTNRYAGWGHPGSKGWLWTEQSALATNVRQAISIHRKEASPAFIALPFQPVQ